MLYTRTSLHQQSGESAQIEGKENGKPGPAPLAETSNELRLAAKGKLHYFQSMVCHFHSIQHTEFCLIFSFLFNGNTIQFVSCINIMSITITKNPK